MGKRNRRKTNDKGKSSSSKKTSSAHASSDTPEVKTEPEKVLEGGQSSADEVQKASVSTPGLTERGSDIATGKNKKGQKTNDKEKPSSKNITAAHASTDTPEFKTGPEKVLECSLSSLDEAAVSTPILTESGKASSSDIATGKNKKGRKTNDKDTPSPIKNETAARVPSDTTEVGTEREKVLARSPSSADEMQKVTHTTESLTTEKGDHESSSNIAKAASRNVTGGNESSSDIKKTEENKSEVQKESPTKDFERCFAEFIKSIDRLEVYSPQMEALRKISNTTLFEFLKPIIARKDMGSIVNRLNELQSNLSSGKESQETIAEELEKIEEIVASHLSDKIHHISSEIKDLEEIVKSKDSDSSTESFQSAGKTLQNVDDEAKKSPEKLIASDEIRDQVNDTILRLEKGEGEKLKKFEVKEYQVKYQKYRTPPIKAEERELAKARALMQATEEINDIILKLEKIEVYRTSKQEYEDYAKGIQVAGETLLSIKEIKVEEDEEDTNIFDDKGMRKPTLDTNICVGKKGTSEASNLSCKNEAIPSEMPNPEMVARFRGFEAFMTIQNSKLDEELECKSEDSELKLVEEQQDQQNQFSSEREPIAAVIESKSEEESRLNLNLKRGVTPEPVSSPEAGTALETSYLSVKNETIPSKRAKLSIVDTNICVVKKEGTSEASSLICKNETIPSEMPIPELVARFRGFETFMKAQGFKLDEALERKSKDSELKIAEDQENIFSSEKEPQTAVPESKTYEGTKLTIPEAVTTIPEDETTDQPDDTALELGKGATIPEAGTTDQPDETALELKKGTTIPEAGTTDQPDETAVELEKGTIPDAGTTDQPDETAVELEKGTTIPDAGTTDQPDKTVLELEEGTTIPEAGKTDQPDETAVELEGTIPEAVTTDEPDETVVVIENGAHTHIEFEADGTKHIFTADNYYFFSPEENRNLTLNFSDVQVRFTGDTVVVSTENNKFDIAVRKPSVVSLPEEDSQNDSQQ